MTVFCGVDWAEGDHDIALVDGEGKLVAKRRIKETPGGFAEFIAMMAEAGDCAEEPIPVAIETPRGLLVAALRATGRPIYPINPLAVARYRERTSLSGKKSDHVDAMALANILRTDAHLHRQLPIDTDLARSITVLARAHQDAVWRRTKLVQELRARLRCRLGDVHHQLASSDARAVLAIVPRPAEAHRVSTARVEAALRRGGRQRGIPARAAAIVAALRVGLLRQDGLVEQAMRVETLALLEMLNAVCRSIQQVAAAVTEAFLQHADYTIITSFSGLADISGAIVLAGDRRRPRPIRRRRGVAGLRRVRTGYPRLGQVPQRRATTDQEQPARRGRVHRGRAPVGDPRALPAPPRPR